LDKIIRQKRREIGEILKGVIEEIIDYCKQKRIDLEQMDFLLIIDDKKRVKVKNTFEVAAKIEELIISKKAHSSLIVFDKKEECPVVGIRFSDDGKWHLEKLNI